MHSRSVATLAEALRYGLCSLFHKIQECKTPEAKVLKALYKLEALIQHNESDIDTWIEIEYELNLTYGTEECEEYPYLRELRNILREEAGKKILEKK